MYYIYAHTNTRVKTVNFHFRKVNYVLFDNKLEGKSITQDKKTEEMSD